ncbi:histidine kinase [Dactylosporangium sp. NPDC050588]|uniref:sensor histidine kinase n=1 Tax=Dactylosporangium sp. NPDC050588 TaxID=3157211 RepID=UPI0033C32725
MAVLSPSGAIPRYVTFSPIVATIVLVVVQWAFTLTTPVDLLVPVLLLAGFLPLHLHHLWAAAHARRPRAGGWTLAAMALIHATGLAVAGAEWQLTGAQLLASVLIVLRPPWSALAAAAIVVTVVSLHVAFVPDGTPGWFSVALIDRAGAALVPAWLAGALHQLQAAREEVAAQAVLAERLRIDDELAGTVGAQLRSIAAGAAVLRDAAPGAAEPDLRVAAARGVQPAGWPVTLAAQALVAEVPRLWLHEAWSAPMMTVGAAAMSLLPGRRSRAAGFVVPYTICLANQVVLVRNLPTGDKIFGLGYMAATAAVFILAMYGTVQLVRLLRELHETRTELAQSAVERERVRVSRDLHDLLGQSLSAISLKGDLAVRLLPLDAAAAHAEIAGIAQAARSAPHDMYAITRHEHAVTLGDEVTAAAALLAAAGVDTEVVGAATPHPVLAWAVREGTTNLPRHSDASR